jgi:hypothetical protein
LQIRSARREELADLELGDVLGKDFIAEIFRVDAADNAWHGDFPRMRRGGSRPGIFLWAPWGRSTAFCALSCAAPSDRFSADLGSQTLAKQP